MKILLVRSARMKQAITLSEFMFAEPIGLECVYGVLKTKHAVRILDLMVDNVAIDDVCREWQPDAVGITSLCVDTQNALDLARRVKAQFPAIVTIVGGTQAFMAPEAFENPCIDHIFVYTTSANLTAFFAILQSGSEIPVLNGIRSRSHGFASNGVAGVNEYLVPDRSSTTAYRAHYSYFGYKPCAIMQTSQGCRQHCAFCFRWRLEGGMEKPQPMDAVIQQISSINESSIMVFDNDLLHDGARLNKLCARLETNGIKKNFMCYGSVRAVLANRAAVARFAGNGLRAVLIGYESFSAQDFDHYHKPSSPDDNLAAAAILRSLGVDAWGSFILHPDWDTADFKRFRRHLRSLRPKVASLSPLTPFLRVPFYESYEHRLLFPRNDYGKWSFSQVTIRPSRMSLRRYYYEVLKSNLYINLWSNSILYMVRKFGVGTVLRLLTGSLRILLRYIRLMRDG